MQKVVAFLEKNVQWLVLALGAAYLLFMVWSYVIKPPVVVTVGGEEVTPAKVDEKVELEKASILEQQMKRPARVPNLTPPNPVDEFLAKLEAAPKHDGLPLVVFMPPTGKLDATADPNRPVDPNQPNQQVTTGPQMEKLPTAPMASEVRAARGRSTVAIPDPGGAVDPAFAQLGPVKMSDEDWVTVRYTVKKDDIVKAFQDAQVPENFMKTQFLRAELVRQEEQSDGSWGPEKPVAPLKISKLPPYPGPQAKVEQAQYNEWSRANQPEIVQPPFYNITKGDQWAVPGEELVQDAGQQNVFDPKNFLDPKADLAGLTPEQRNEVMAARRAAMAEKEAARKAASQGQRQPRQGGTEGGGEFQPPPGAGGGPGGGGRRGGGRGPGQAVDPNRPRGYQVPPQQPGGFGPQGEFGPGMMPGSEFAPGQQQQMQPQQQNWAQLFPIPNGEFDPRTLTADVTGWVHDDTVEPGKVYRYKVRYRIKSPVYQTFNVLKNQNLANEFDLGVAESEWTDAVAIPALTSFYLASEFQADTSRQVRFEVFKFQDGVLHAQTFNASPGDVVGKKDKAVDFNTGWTVVDIRRDLRNNLSYVLLTDPTGRLEQRSYRADQDDAELKKLRQQLNAQAAVSGGPG